MFSRDSFCANRMFEAFGVWCSECADVVLCDRTEKSSSICSAAVVSAAVGCSLPTVVAFVVREKIADHLLVFIVQIDTQFGLSVAISDINKQTTLYCQKNEPKSYLQ